MHPGTALVRGSKVFRTASSTAELGREVTQDERLKGVVGVENMKQTIWKSHQIML